MKYLRSFNESADPNIILDIEDFLLDLSDMGYYTKVYDYTNDNNTIVVDMANIIGRYGAVLDKFLSDTEETYIRIIEYMKLNGYNKVPNSSLDNYVEYNKGKDLYRGVMKARYFPKYLNKRRLEWTGDGVRYHDYTNPRDPKDFVTSNTDMTVFLKEITFSK